MELQKTDSIESLISLITGARQSLLAAGEMLVRLVANDPSAIERARKAAPSIPPGLFNSLLKVGERSLHPELLLNNCAAYRRLRTLSYTVQESTLKNRDVELVVDADSGDVLMVPITELTIKQATQVIGPTGVRSRDDQRAQLKRNHASSPIMPKQDTAAWFVKRDRLVVTRECDLSRTQLLAALAEMA